LSTNRLGKVVRVRAKQVRAGLGVLLATVLAACGGDAAAEEPVTVRLGYLPNITHAPAIVGIEDGLFAEALGEDVTLEPTSFNAGSAVIEAVFAGAIDASYIGPNPAINAWAQSQGEAIRIVAGSTSGGAFLVVREGLDAVEDLRGTRIATPQLGNTQDVALRSYLADQGLVTDTSGGGDIAIVPQENAQTLELFTTGDIDGAWVPEPWAARLIQEAGGQVLLDERELWPDGRYVTTHLLVRAAFLEEHPDVVSRLLEGHLDAIEAVTDDPEAAQATVNAGIEAITGNQLGDELIAAAWENLEFTVDPVASSLVECASDAEAVGLLDPVDLEGIYALDPLNELLAERGEEPVEGLE